MIGNPICDPFTNLPVKFDIENIAAELRPKEKAVEVEKDKEPRDFLHLEDKNWVVLPKFKYELEHLIPSLSLRTNPYMRCRFRKFLNDVPDSYVKIRLYREVVDRMPQPRRKSLNGQFYGVDYKLAPIPAVLNPRNFSASELAEQKRRIKAAELKATNSNNYKTKKVR
ncbi:uncharacterized protein LOC115621568 [Scaptodrosophila lebanonensis]|uniref:Uncharacterized protein LOC115621568 n=1 Tax=Drosophila lebanonensis TaxID=7225 RepID=A0A6J2T750_DROLE|nr:uncharacterized protein LOC115621568 [Scaptodrosophila lebanonensis]